MRDVETLTDAEVLERTRRLRARERANTAALIEHLVEVERRGVFAEAGYPSMFKYLVGALGYPEDAAYKRARVARLVRDVPLVLDHLADGRLHLSGAVVLAPLLSAGDAPALLAQAVGRSKRELEQLVADLAPRPSPATQVRRLPQPATAENVTRGLALDAPISPRPGTGVAEISPRGEIGAVSAAPAFAGREGPDGPAVSPRGESLTRGCTVDASRDRGRMDAPSLPPATTGSTTAATRASAPPPRPLPAKMTPLGGEQYRVAFSASQATVGKIRQLVALMSHQVPSGDLGECLDRALDVALGRLERERFGSPRNRPTQPATPTPSTEPATDGPAPTVPAATEPAAPSPAATELAATQPAATQPAATSSTSADPSPRSRHIPAATRRAVFERDGGRCAYVAPDGRRCGENGWLELHHAGVPFALGGAHDVDNLALFCRAHNQWAGRKVFGERPPQAQARSRSS